MSAKSDLQAAEELRLRQVEQLEREKSALLERLTQKEMEFFESKSKEKLLEADGNDQSSELNRYVIMNDLKEELISEILGAKDVSGNVKRMIDSAYAGMNDKIKARELEWKRREEQKKRAIAAEQEHNRELEERLLKKQDQIVNLRESVEGRKIEFGEKAAKKERKKFETEKETILADLKNRVEKVGKLELEIDGWKEKYAKLESFMSDG